MEKYREYRKKWNEYPIIFVQECVPLHLDLEVTTRCNYKCIMCSHSFNPPKPKDIDVELAKQTIREFAEKGGYAIKFCYLGEPTLYTHLVELVKFAKDLGIVDTRVSTNGSLLNKTLSKELIEAGLDLIIFSVDSIYPEIYESIRVGGNLNKVIRNIMNLYEIRSCMGLDRPEIQVQIIPMEQNKKERESGEYKTFFSQWADIMWEEPWCLDLRAKYNIGYTRGFKCPAPYQRLLLRANGDICLCCGTEMISKYIGHYPEMSIEEAWNSPFVKKVRKYLNDDKAHLISPCRECEERYYYERYRKQ